MKYFIIGLLLSLSAHVNAAFIPTSDTVELFNLENLLPNAEAGALFALIQEGDTGGPRVPINFDPFSGALLPGDQIEFTPVASNLGGGFAFRNFDEGSDSLVLPSPVFDVAMFDGNNWLLPDAAVQSGPEAFELSWGSTAGLTVNDVAQTTNAVPVPAAAWLFGSGLLGLAGVARRTDD